MGTLMSEWERWVKKAPSDIPDEVVQKFKEVYFLGAATAHHETQRIKAALTEEEKKAIEDQLAKDMLAFIKEALEKW